MCCVRAALGSGVWPFPCGRAAWVGHASACQASVVRPSELRSDAQGRAFLENRRSPGDRSLTVAASMRRPLPVKRKIRGFQGACPLAEYEAAPHARVARRPPRTTRPTARLAEGPLSLISVASSERRGFVKGAPLLRGLRTLDKFPPFWNLDPEGKGAGGLRGLAPWRSMRQRLMRA